MDAPVKPAHDDFGFVGGRYLSADFARLDSLL
jgi:hypothetical protein